MSTLARAFAILDLFENGSPLIEADEVCASLGFSRPTGYRYLAELVRAGFLVRIGGGAYSLGPRIIELDYAVRSKDPVLTACRPVMQRLVAATGGECTLSSMYGDRVVTTHHERGPEQLVLSHDRGHAMPPVLTALSRCLLAYQAASRQKRLYEQHARDIKAHRLADDWDAFRSLLARIRKTGYAISLGEMGGGRAAVAAPILHANASILATVAVVLPLPRYELTDKDQLVELVIAGARQIEHAMRTPVMRSLPQKADSEPARIQKAGVDRSATPGDNAWTKTRKRASQGAKP